MQKVNPFEVQYRKCHISNWRYQVSSIFNSDISVSKIIVNFHLSCRLICKYAPKQRQLRMVLFIPFKYFLDQIFFFSFASYLISDFSHMLCANIFKTLWVYFCNCTPTDSIQWNKLKVMNNLNVSFFCLINTKKNKKFLTISGDCLRKLHKQYLIKIIKNARSS